MKLESFYYRHNHCLDEVDTGHGICALGGGSQPSGNTTTTQNTTPWSGQQGYLSQGFGAAQGLYNNSADYPQYYGSSTVVPFNQQETSGLGQLYNTASNPTLSNESNQNLEQLMNGTFMNAGNPYFQSMANQVEGQMTPQLMKGFTQGNTDNPNIAFAASQGLGNALGSLAYQNYSQGLDNMVKANAVAPSAQQTNLSNAQAAYGAGQTTQSQDQAQLQDQINRFNYQQTLPYNMLDQYMGTIQGNYGGSSTLTQPYYSNPSSNILSLGSGLLGMNGMTGSSGGGFGSTLLGGLGSWIFSDRRLKKNITKIGHTSVLKLPLYEFNYIWEKDLSPKHTGVMAQEAIQVIPEAIRYSVTGFMSVDYRKVA